MKPKRNHNEKNNTASKNTRWKIIYQNEMAFMFCVSKSNQISWCIFHNLFSGDLLGWRLWHFTVGNASSKTTLFWASYPVEDVSNCLKLKSWLAQGLSRPACRHIFGFKSSRCLQRNQKYIKNEWKRIHIQQNHPNHHVWRCVTAAIRQPNAHQCRHGTCYHDQSTMSWRCFHWRFLELQNVQQTWVIKCPHWTSPNH